MKVLFLSPVSYFKGGAERSLFDLFKNPKIEALVAAPSDGELVSAAKDQGLKTSIIPFGQIESIHRPFKFLSVPYALRDLYQAARQLKSISAEHEIKIVHSNGLKAHVVNCLAERMGGAPAVLHIRDIPYTASEKAVWYMLQKTASQMVIVSRACWPGKSLPKNVSVIYNGADAVGLPATIADDVTTNQLMTTPTEYCKSTVSTIEPERSILNVPFKPILTLGFVGRIHPAKGLHLLLDWLAAARTASISARLIVRGKFSADAPEYEEAILSQIRALELDDYVEFANFVDNPDEIYRPLDIVVVPSHVPDPLPRSVMESMAHGVPVIGYPAGGIGEMIVDGETGYLAKNEAEFIAAVQSITGDSSVKTKLCLQGKHRIDNLFSIQALHNNMEFVYKKCV